MICMCVYICIQSYVRVLIFFEKLDMRWTLGQITSNVQLIHKVHNFLSFKKTQGLSYVPGLPRVPRAASASAFSASRPSRAALFRRRSSSKLALAFLRSLRRMSWLAATGGESKHARDIVTKNDLWDDRNAHGEVANPFEFNQPETRCRLPRNHCICGQLKIKAEPEVRQFTNLRPIWQQAFILC